MEDEAEHMEDEGEDEAEHRVEEAVTAIQPVLPSRLRLHSLQPSTFIHPRVLYHL